MEPAKEKKKEHSDPKRFLVISLAGRNIKKLICMCMQSSELHY
jgi:hypothetical protein